MIGFGGFKARYFGYDRLQRVTVDMSSATWNTVGTHEVLTVTGLVRMLLFWQVTTSFTSGGAATMDVGDDGGLGNYGTAYPVASLVTDRFLVPGGANVALARESSLIVQHSSAAYFADVIYIGRDVGFEVKVAAFTAGVMVCHCFWSPISSDGSVVAGVGGALL